MSSRLPMIDEEGEVRELNAEDFALFRPAAEVLAPDLYAGLLAMNRRSRGPNKNGTKVATTIRLSPDVVNHFRATGAGWQTRIDEALKDWIKAHPAG